MEDEQEEEKDESPEAKKRRFLSKWSKVIDQDVEEIKAHENVKQRPLSRAYLSLCSAGRDRNKQV
jgi:hypothetical protein